MSGTWCLEEIWFEAGCPLQVKTAQLVLYAFGDDLVLKQGKAISEMVGFIYKCYCNNKAHPPFTFPCFSPTICISRKQTIG